MYWNSEVNPAAEPRRVTLTRGDWVDQKRHGRRVPYKIYTPEQLAGDQKFPVIIWSHGLGGSRDGAGFISRFVASHGYVIVHIQHIGTDTILWDGKPGHPWDNIRAAVIPRTDVLKRYADVPFALAQLRTLAATAGDPVGSVMDMSRLGMSGHSFGALTTQIMAGQRIVRGKQHYNLKQDDFIAGILYSPVPGRKDPGDPELVYGGITLPLLHITGTDDESPVEGFGYEKRLNVFNHADSDDQHLIIIKGGDHMVFNGSRGQLADNPDRARHEEIIKILSLAWWDARLKNDKNARDWLQGNGVVTYLNGDATVETKEK